MIGALAAALVLNAALAMADGSGDPTAVKDEDGKYYDAQGNPTYKVESDKSVDWYTYSGFRRYHSDCHTCHGWDISADTEAAAADPAMREPLERHQT